MSKGTASVGTDEQMWSHVVKGFEQVFGTSGDDRFVGNKHHNTLNGGAGDDWFRSGLGADKLVGGEGADTFVFVRKDVTDKSVDWITDFEVGVDMLDFSDFASVRAVDVDGDTVVQGLVKGAYQDVVRLDNVLIDAGPLDDLLV